MGVGTTFITAQVTHDMQWSAAVLLLRIVWKQGRAVLCYWCKET